MSVFGSIWTTTKEWAPTVFAGIGVAATVATAATAASRLATSIKLGKMGDAMADAAGVVAAPVVAVLGMARNTVGEFMRNADEWTNGRKTDKERMDEAVAAAMAKYDAEQAAVAAAMAKYDAEQAAKQPKPATGVPQPAPASPSTDELVQRAVAAALARDAAARQEKRDRRRAAEAAAQAKPTGKRWRRPVARLGEGDQPASEHPASTSA